MLDTTMTISTDRAIQIAQGFMTPSDRDRPLSKLGHGMLYSMTFEDYEDLVDIIDRNLLSITMIRPINCIEADINDENIDDLLDLRLWVTDAIESMFE